jgi:hypothetical protein
MEDDVKAKWLRRNNPKSIQQIDAHCSDVRDKNAFEMIANRWNSETFNPTTMVSNCHYDFSQEIDIGFDATADFARACPTKVWDKLAKMKSDLCLIIEKWERSGQGDGGRVDEEDDETTMRIVFPMLTIAQTNLCKAQTILCKNKQIKSGLTGVAQRDAKELLIAENPSLDQSRHIYFISGMCWIKMTCSTQPLTG